MLSQIVAVSAINLKSIPQRLGSSLSTVLASAIVVGVLLAFLAMANGFMKTVAGAGADDIALVMRPGSQSELNSVVSLDQTRIIAQAPQVARLNGTPLADPEVYVIVNGTKRSSGTDVNVPLRGVSDQAFAVRDNVRLVAGRMFEPGRTELIVGSGVLREFAGFDLGQEARLGKTVWTVVGVFDAAGSVFESEVWADAQVIQNLYNRGTSYQVDRVRLTSADALDAFNAFLEADPRLKLQAQSERDYLSKQGEALSTVIKRIGWPIAITMALGALAGALNTMYASVAARQREIGTLRAIGFGGFATFVGTLVESLILAAAGGLLGAVGAYLLFQDMTTSTLSGSFTQVVFRFEMSPFVVVQGILLAIAVGLLGGIPPALRAARVPVVVAFRAG